MQHINIQDVEDKALEFQNFANSQGLSPEVAADYRARAASLFRFAKDLKRWR